MRRNLKKKAIVLVSILLVSYLVLGCAQRKGSTSSGVWEIEERIVVGTQEIPEYIREMVIANRVIEEVDNDYLRDNIDKFFYEYDDNKGEIPFNDLLGNERTSKTSVTVAEAIEDVNVLFSLFKFGYAGYQYFGGDKVFLAAKDRIIDNLNEVNEESIGRQAFARIILNEMCFIQDGHVSLKAGGRFKQFFKEHNMLFSDKYQFTKYESNFYTLINGEKFYLTSVDGKAPGEKMNLSINEAG
ncbi:hypothetical protein JYT98_01170, partial [bacterium AH-315-K05]|nr:hypothetical protein [bacterium AH-315-K05]